jgi:cytochrome c oxidase assembly factor CtaG
VDAVLKNWSYDPFMVVIAVIAAVHARGLRRHLGSMRRSGRPTRAWLGQAVLFWSGLGVLLLAVVSPVDYWSDTYLTSHVIQHILLAFVAPPLIVLGAPWVPLLLGLPRPVGRWYALVLQRTRPVRPGSGRPVWRWAVPLRRLSAKPWTSIVAFNVAMIFWHLPVPFGWAAGNQTVHIWLAHGSFFALGVALWLQIFASYPFRPVLAPPARVLALMATNAVMVVIAMTMVMFSRDLYDWYAPLGAAGQAADQQIAGSILWVCGEVTFLPSILVTIAAWVSENDTQPSPAVASPVA